MFERFFILGFLVCLPLTLSAEDSDKSTKEPLLPKESTTTKMLDNKAKPLKSNSPSAPVLSPRTQANNALFAKMAEFYQLDAAGLAAVEKIFAGSTVMSQGNPVSSVRAMTQEECQQNWKKADHSYENKEHETICGSKNMAPLYKSATEKISDAKVCIDKFEFPNIACEYPLVWTTPPEAAQICESLGKRLCDAHEWEGACEGSLEEPDYVFDPKGLKRGADEIRRMRSVHNLAFAPKKSWAYGKAYEKGKCGTGSFKHADCDGGSWAKCGSNTFPVGSFPQCRSSLDVYDSHGNAAEIMNIPSNKDEMAKNNKTGSGHTELKGSWFLFDKYYAHQDWCRWRAPYWHGDLTAKSHHHMYHLGFRCCKDIQSAKK